jgi:hypothetical protein
MVKQADKLGTYMARCSPKLLPIAAVLALLSVAAFGFAYWPARDGAGVPGRPEFVQPSESPAPPADSRAERTLDTSEPIVADQPTASAASTTRGPEPFRDWLAAYLQTDPDLDQLRRDLREALASLESAETDSAASAEEVAALEAIRRAEHTAGTDYRSLMDLAERFLETHPGSPLADDVKDLLARYARLWDEHDFQEVCSFSQSAPQEFAACIARHEAYIERHGAAGGHTRQAELAIRQIRTEWAEHDYRAIYDSWVRYPSDVPTLARRVRRYLDDHPAGRQRAAAEQFLSRFEQAAVPRQYRVTVKSGSFARTIGDALSRGPDLAVELEVAGTRIGRTPIIEDSYEPVWNYEFPQKVRWRLGDTIKIRVIDFDYRNQTVLLVEPSKDDPLAMRFLTGPISAEGHRLVFESDFAVPTLPPP